MSEDRWDTLLSVDEARSRILQAFQKLPPESVRLEGALHRILAEVVTSPHDLPRFDNSSVDGFALRLAKFQGSSLEAARFQVVADIPAGTSVKSRLQPGQAARIMTGAQIPTGCDRVAPVEDTDFPYRDSSASPPEFVQVSRLPEKAANIRPRGQDIRKGSQVLPSGRRLSAAEIGLLAMLGMQKVAVYRLPKIALFSSGDELIKPGSRLSGGKIYDSNNYMLQGLIAEAGGLVVPLGIARDDLRIIRGYFETAIKRSVDLIVTTAGVSVGAFDYVRKILEEEGKVELWRVNMRPGKPLTFGTYRSTPVISLPGNPVSAYVSFLVFVLPVIRKMLGLESLLMPTIQARLEHEVSSDGRESYLRAIVRKHGGELTAALTGHQGSGNLYALAQANALLILPSGVQSLPAGAEVHAWILSDVQE